MKLYDKLLDPALLDRFSVSQLLAVNLGWAFLGMACFMIHDLLAWALLLPYFVFNGLFFWSLGRRPSK
jgi:hypothetical protein